MTAKEIRRSNGKPQQPPEPYLATEAEAQVAQAILVEGSRFLPLVDFLQVEHFADPRLREVYRAALELDSDGRPCDLPSIADHLRRTSKLEAVGGTPFLAGLVGSFASTVPAVEYAREVAKAALLRRFAYEADWLRASAVVSTAAEVFSQAADRISGLKADLDLVSSSSVLITNFAEVDDLLSELTWLWPGHIPNGLLSMLVGVDGIGKSKVAVQLLSSVLLGTPWPDGSKPDPDLQTRSVVYLDTEGSHAVNRARIRSAGIPLDRVIWPVDPRTGDRLSEIRLDDARSLDLLRRAAIQYRPALIVVDALRGAMGGDENSSRDVLGIKALAKIARDTGTAVLLLHHRGKQKPDSTKGVIEVDDIRGSTAIRQFCRAIMALDEPDPDDERKRLRWLKLTVGDKPPEIGVIHDGDSIRFYPSAPAVQRKETTVDRAVDWLRTALAHGARPASELIEEAEAVGISKASLFRARERLGAVSRPVFEDGHRGAKAHEWGLPATRVEAPPERDRYRG